MLRRNVRKSRAEALFAACLVMALAWGSSAWGGEIRLMSGTIDTSSAPAATQSATKADVASTLLIQFEGPIQPEWVNACRSAGVALHHYVPDFAYIATIPTKRMDAIKASPGVAWVGELPASMKIRPELGKLTLAKAMVAVTILDTDESAQKYIRAKGYTLTSTRLSTIGWYETRAELPLAALEEIATLPGVFYIEKQSKFQLHGERAAQTAAGNYIEGAAAPTGPGYTAWLASHGLSGAPGVIVQVQDDGLDQGIATNEPGTAHPDILGRIAGIYNATSDALGDSTAGHGQINAGIIIGNATAGLTDLDGYHFGQGLAPLASVFATKLFTNAGSWDTGDESTAQLAKHAQDAGAIFSSNSWGASVSGQYTSDSAEFDALTRDADSSEAGNQQMTYFFSAGNSGSNSGTLGSPASAKNVIAVGAGENSDGLTYTDASTNTDQSGIGPSGADNIKDLIYFSSRGPAEDGRLGVTVVAVGTHVSGPASTSPNYAGDGVSDKYWPADQTMYARSSGTSHSCPTACGAGLIVHEFFSTQLAPLGHTASPSPAMIKAALANTAQDMKGGSDGASGTLASIPNAQQGWGSVNLSNLVEMKESLFTLDQTEVFTASGQSWSQTVSAADSSKPLKITLVWTDAPASPLANPAIVNDLDLTVTQDSTTYLGNHFESGLSATGGAADRLNTIEAVYVPNPSGIYTITVTAHNIAGDGVPNEGEALDQDFALFVWNNNVQSSKGSINILPSYVSCSGSLSVSVSDSDLRGAGTQQARVVSSSGDSEAATCVESGTDTGILFYELNTSSDVPQAQDGMLQVADGDTITATYEDEDTGDGSAASVQATATVDCVPATLSNVQVSEIASLRAKISFNANEPVTAVIHYGLAMDALHQSKPISLSSDTHSTTLSNLEPLTPYYFTVESTDRAGNASTDDNNGAGYTFTTLERPDYYTEVFDAEDNDLANHALRFTPNGSISYYSLESFPADVFPDDPVSDTRLFLDDDSATQVSLTDGKQVQLYGTAYSSFYVGSNGYISFGEYDERNTATTQHHFSLPRISALMNDLDPETSGVVSWRQWSDHVSVAWQAVPIYDMDNENNFQIQMYFDGTIRITYLRMDASEGLAGLSQGQGLPEDYIESDLTAFEIIDDLEVTPETGFLPEGVIGGPFSPSIITYTLHNGGSTSLNWTVECSQSWLALSSPGGSLAPDESVTVDVSLAAEVDALAVGVYTDLVTFTNTATSVTRNRSVRLAVNAPPPIIRVEAPNSLNITLKEGEQTTLDPGLRIYNDGVADLSYLIRVENSDTSISTEEERAVRFARVQQAVESMRTRSGIGYGPFSLGSNRIIKQLYSESSSPVAYDSPDDIASVLTAGEAGVTPLSGAYDVAVCGADSSEYLSDVRSKLISTGRFTSVTVIDLHAVTPKLEELRAFSAVLVFSNDSYADAATLGDVMADYVDEGGGVVGCVFEICGDILDLSGYVMGGRWATSDYVLMDRNDVAWYEEESLGVVEEPTHSIMSGVTEFSGGDLSFHPGANTAYPGVDIVARWTDGRILVAASENNGVRRADLGFFPVSDTVWLGLLWDSTTDGAALMANALDYVSGSGASWLTFESPARGTVVSGTEPNEKWLKFDATGLELGVYTVDLVIRSNDLTQPEITLPCTLSVVSEDLMLEPGVAPPITGPVYGPFTPSSVAFTLSNPGASAFEWSAASSDTWLDAAPSGGSIAAGESVVITVSPNAAADALSSGSYAATVLFTNTTAGLSVSRTIHLEVEPQVAYFVTLDSQPSTWTANGQWQYGAPLGGGGAYYGGPDPTSGKTGATVYGVNLSGDYDIMPGGPYYLVAGPFDCTYYTQTQLAFARWLNTDHPNYVPCTVEVSSDNANWTTIWASEEVITDRAWTDVQYDISAVADRQAQVYVRWGYTVFGNADENDFALQYSGWNIDDVKVLGDPDNIDSDNDGVPDRIEVQLGSDPYDPNDVPVLPLEWDALLAAFLLAGAVFMIAAWKKKASMVQ